MKLVWVAGRSYSVNSLITIERIPLMTVTTKPMATDNNLKLSELKEELELLFSASSVIFFWATFNPKMMPNETPSNRKLKKKVMSLAAKICLLRTPWFSHLISEGFGASFSEKWLDFLLIDMVWFAVLKHMPRMNPASKPSCSCTRSFCSFVLKVT